MRYLVDNFLKYDEENSFNFSLEYNIGGYYLAWITYTDHYFFLFFLSVHIEQF